MTKKEKRNITEKETRILFALSAGRCNICNKSCVIHPLTKGKGNFAERAHIYDYSLKADVRPVPPRDMKEHLTSTMDNILLLCRECHQEIDKERPEEWPVEKLQKWKKRHEDKIHSVTECEKETHFIHYHSNINTFSPTINLRETISSANTYDRYPASIDPPNIGNNQNPFDYTDPEFWTYEEKQLTKKFNQYGLEDKLAVSGEHFSVFALASQPMLMKLGSMLGALAWFEVYPKNRSDSTPWGWTGNEETNFIINEPTLKNGAPVISLKISGSHSTKDIQALSGYLGQEELSIYEVTIDEMEIDKKWAIEDNESFRKSCLKLINRIHEEHGDVPIHVFPAMPNHLCVEFGRAKLPTTHPDLVIHNYLRDHGWMQTITI